MDGKMDALIDLQAIAAEAFAALDTGHQITPFSARFTAFGKGARPLCSPFRF